MAHSCTRGSLRIAKDNNGPLKGGGGAVGGCWGQGLQLGTPPPPMATTVGEEVQRERATVGSQRVNAPAIGTSSH